MKRLKCWWRGYHRYSVVIYVDFRSKANTYECIDCHKMYRRKA